MVKDKEFLHNLQHKVQELLDDGTITTIVDVTKTNDTILSGLRFESKDDPVAPVLYLESAYESYKFSGAALDEIAMEVFNAYLRNKRDLNISAKLTPEYITENVLPHLINAEMNEEYVKDKLYRSYLDMYIVLNIPIHLNDEEMGLIVLSAALIENLGLNTDELFEAAFKNIENDFEIISLADVVREVDPLLPEELAGPQMLVASNKNRCYGASVILAESVKKELSARLHGDFLLIPSSVHECIAVQLAGIDPDYLRGFVGGVNSGLLKNSEILSNNIYMYRSDDDAMDIVQPGFSLLVNGGDLND